MAYLDCGSDCDYSSGSDCDIPGTDSPRGRGLYRSVSRAGREAIVMVDGGSHLGRGAV